MLKDGEGDEALEVGVLRYKQGPGIGQSFLFFFLSLFSPLHTINIRRWSFCCGRARGVGKAKINRRRKGK